MGGKTTLPNLIANLQADIFQLRLREGERLFQHNLGIRTPLRISPRLPVDLHDCMLEMRNLVDWDTRAGRLVIFLGPFIWSLSVQSHRVRCPKQSGMLSRG